MCARLEPGSTRPAWTAATAAWWAAACWPLPLLELGLLWILECLWRELAMDHRTVTGSGAYLVSSSEREKRFVQPGNVQAWGFSPV